MKQILQNLKTGDTELVELPEPMASAGKVCIEMRAPLISAGTEKMMVDLERAGWIEKPKQQLGKVQQVLDKMRTCPRSAPDGHDLGARPAVPSRAEALFPRPVALPPQADGVWFQPSPDQRRWMTSGRR